MNLEKYALKYATFFETLNKDVPFKKYKEFFDKNSYFEDPFNCLYGASSIYKLFIHMYEKLAFAKFIVKDVAFSKNLVYIYWQFEFKLSKNDEMKTLDGISKVKFCKSGIVKSHIDYWDSTKYVYSKVPILSFFISLIRKKLSFKDE